jgi:hypothetical protein
MAARDTKKERRTRTQENGQGVRAYMVVWVTRSGDVHVHAYAYVGK